MNLNTLIIVACGSRARLFRTAQTNAVEQPVELVEMETIEPAAAPGTSDSHALEPSQQDAPATGDEALRALARRIAERVAHFAHYHFCNPVILAGPHALCSAIDIELARELPSAHIRSFVGEVAQLSRLELLHDLERRGAFTAPRYRYQA